MISSLPRYWLFHTSDYTIMISMATQRTVLLSIIAFICIVVVVLNTITTTTSSLRFPTANTTTTSSPTLTTASTTITSSPTLTTASTTTTSSPTLTTASTTTTSSPTLTTASTTTTSSPTLTTASTTTTSSPWWTTASATGDPISRIPFKPVCDMLLEKLRFSRNPSIQSFPNLKGYILVLTIEQQTQSALLEFFALARIAASHRLQIVEPMFTSGHFKLPRALRIDGRNVQLLRFSDLYDLNAANKQIGECLGIDYPIIAPLEDFISAANSSVEVIFLNLMKRQIEQWCENENEKQQHIKSIEEMIGRAFAQVPASMTGAHKQPYLKISKVVCVDARKTVNLTKVLSPVVPFGNNITNSTAKTTFIVPQWIGIQFPPQYYPDYYHDPDYVRKDCPYLRTLQHSEALVTSALQYWTQLNLSRPRFGIQMRLQNLLTSGYNETDVKQCTDGAIATLETIRDRDGLDLHNAVFIRDYSSMGTVGCGRCTQVAKGTGFDEKLKHLGVHIIEYHNIFPCTTGDRAYISFLEKELVAQADYLLTVGDGSFTGSLIRRFLVNNPAERKFHSC